MADSSRSYRSDGLLRSPLRIARLLLIVDLSGDWFASARQMQDGCQHYAPSLSRSFVTSCWPSGTDLTSWSKAASQTESRDPLEVDV